MLLGIFALAAPAHAITYLSEDDAAFYRSAFAALKDERGQEALSLASRARDRTLHDIVTGLSLAAEDSPADFPAYVQYLDGHIAWPKSQRKAIARQAEQHLAGQPPATVLAFFAANEVETPEGLAAYASALQASGQPQKASDAIQAFWLNSARDSEAQETMLRLFGGILPHAAIEARLDNLLWERRAELARRLLPHASSGWQKLAQARLALAKMDDKAPQLLNEVPGHLQDQPGLLYERVRWRRKKEDASGAVAMLDRAPRDTSHTKAWWDERNALARGLLDAGDARGAYRLAAAHGLDASAGNPYQEAEFLAGWIALRHLNTLQQAQAHFQRLYASGETPITLARGAYWLARTAETAGRAGEAQPLYVNAASYGTTFYGQLAASRLYPAAQISATSPLVPETARQQFEAAPQATLIAQLAQAGGSQAAEDFALAWAGTMNQAHEFRLLADLALRLSDQDLAVKISKAAARKKILLPVEGYPVLNLPPGQGDAALIHALTRQESQFDPVVVSPSNAQGLMQLLPSTARWVAGKMGMEERDPNLFDPSTNVRLGSAYIAMMLEKFDGSLPLAVASYNAGPGRIGRWVAARGDPRGNPQDGRIDMVDWVESIPFDETRNYVQRVLEAMQVYRAKFAGGTAPLTLAQDLNGQRQIAVEAAR